MRTLSFRAIPMLVAACACVQAQAPTTQTFDGKRALEDVRKIVAIGTRVSGTPGAQKTRDYITSQLTPLGLKAEEQPFVGETPHGPVKMVNLRVRLPGGDGPGRLVIAGHYD